MVSFLGNEIEPINIIHFDHMHTHEYKHETFHFSVLSFQMVATRLWNRERIDDDDKATTIVRKQNKMNEWNQYSQVAK